MADSVEREVKNLVLLQRFANGLSREGRAVFRMLLEELAAEVARYDPGAVLPRYRQARIDRLLRAAQAVAADGFSSMRLRYTDALAAFGDNQMRYAERIMEAAGVPITNAAGRMRMRQILRDDAMDGRTLTEWVRSAQASFLDGVTKAVRTGAEQESSADEIWREIRGPIAQRTRRHIDGIARTATTATSNRAHLEVYRANEDVLSGVQFLATLDSRTTPVCARWDATVWKVDDPAIQKPPLHFNCRSQLVPVVDWKGLGIDPPAEGMRASDSGPTRAKSYEEWFRRQSASKQDEIIGPTRAKLFRRGTISFREMVTQDNRVVPVEDLT